MHDRIGWLIGRGDLAANVDRTVALSAPAPAPAWRAARFALGAVRAGRLAAGILDGCAVRPACISLILRRAASFRSGGAAGVLVIAVGMLLVVRGVGRLAAALAAPPTASTTPARACARALGVVSACIRPSPVRFARPGHLWWLEHEHWSLERRDGHRLGRSGCRLPAVPASLLRCRLVTWYFRHNRNTALRLAGRGSTAPGLGAPR